MTAPLTGPVAPSAELVLRPVVLVVVALVVGVAGACSDDDGWAESVQRWSVEVLEELPADPEAFTQGLELTADGRLFETVGRYGRSDVRVVDPATGEVLARQPIDAHHFAEGLTLVDDRLIVLTWREGTAYVFDADTLEELDRYAYEGDGWGLCLDDDRLVMSDGSSELTFRHPDTFEVTGTVSVTVDGAPLDNINELECIDSLVYANIWHTDDIVVIDPDDGEVVAVIDASGLLAPQDAAEVDVLNGIAAVPGADDELLLTGKLWPSMFRVRVLAES